MTKVIMSVLVILFLVLQWSRWGERGIWSWYSLERTNQRLQESNDELRERNRSLAREIEDLKTGVGVLEEKAREDLGMVRRGESFFKIIDLSSEPKRQKEQP